MAKQPIKKQRSPASLTHDINNHLTSIGLTAEIMLGDLESPKSQKRPLQQILKDVRAIKNLVQKIKT